MENNFIKLGIHQFNIGCISGMSKDEFVSAYKGKLTIDINEAWDKLQAKIKENAPKENTETTEQSEKTARYKGSSKGFVPKQGISGTDN